MPIIISRDGRDARRIEASPPTRERDLQAYITENPMVLPIDEVAGDSKLLIVAREFGTDSGPIDVLAIDDHGSVYVIETKLYENPDKRRVVAQVLDYGAALWLRYGQSDDFVADMEQASLHQGTGLRERISQAFGGDASDVDRVLDAAKRNVGDGDLRFIVLMDRLHDRLRDLIQFLNAKSRFSLYAVELEFYHHDGLEIVIPRLFGSQVVKEVKRPAGPVEARYQWDVTRFLQDLTTNAAVATPAVQQVVDSLRGHDVIELKNADFHGRHAKMHVSIGLLAPKPLFTLWSEDGTLTLWAEATDRTEAARAFRRRIVGRLVDGQFCPSPATGEVDLPPSEWAGKVDLLLATVRDELGRPSTTER